MLLIGSEDEETRALLSLYDKKPTTFKARHLFDALCFNEYATENYIKTTWLEYCEKAVEIKFPNIKRGRTICNWYLDIHASTKLQFHCSTRGR